MSMTALRHDKDLREIREKRLKVIAELRSYKHHLKLWEEEVYREGVYGNGVYGEGYMRKRVYGVYGKVVYRERVYGDGVYGNGVYGEGVVKRCMRKGYIGKG